MLLKRTTLYVTLTLLLTQTPSMRSGSPSHPYNNTNQRSVHRLAKILSHINPPREQTPYPLQSCSAKQIDLIHATPEQIELFMQDPTNIPLLRKKISNGIGRIPLENLGVLLLNPTLRGIIVQYALDNFVELAKEFSGVHTAIMHHCPDAAQAFLQPALENFSQLCNDYGSYLLLRSIMDHCPDAAQAFLQPAIENFSQLCNNENRQYILKEILKRYPDAAQAFAKHMENEPRSFYPFNDLFKNRTQTEQHLIYNLRKYKDLSSVGYVNYEDYDELQRMTKLVVDLEYKEQEKSRYTFMHAHQWGFHFYQELYTDLWSIINEKPSNHRFTRFKYPKEPSLETFFIYIQNEQETRQKLMSGALDRDYISADYQDRLLFMNYALFANNGGSNSGYIIKSNRSERPIQIDCNQFLCELRLDNLLTQEELENIRKQFNELQSEHATLSKYGAGLLLSFTPELMAQCVYPCHPGGRKRTVKIEGFGDTSNPKVILNTLRTTPEKIVPSVYAEDPEFVCVLSHDSTLIPNNGLDIYEFNAADQEKLAAWRVKKDTLMAWIKERVNKRRQSLTAQAATQKMHARL